MMIITDIERACKLAEIAQSGVGVVLKPAELRMLLDEITKLREEIARLEEEIKDLV